MGKAEKEFVTTVTRMYLDVILSNSRSYGEMIGTIVNETLSRNPEEVTKASMNLVEGVLDTIDPNIVNGFMDGLLTIRSTTLKFRFISIVTKMIGFGGSLYQNVIRLFKSLGLRAPGKKVVRPTHPSKDKFQTKEEFEQAMKVFEEKEKNFDNLVKEYNKIIDEDKEICKDFFILSLVNGGDDVENAFNTLIAEFEDAEFTGE